VRARLLEGSDDRRISADGVLVIKAQRFRTQERNRADALEAAAGAARRRGGVHRWSAKATRPTRAAKRRRVGRQGPARRVKAGRAKVVE
jgi:ribosome-associated protein